MEEKRERERGRERGKEKERERGRERKGERGRGRERERERNGDSSRFEGIPGVGREEPSRERGGQIRAEPDQVSLALGVRCISRVCCEFNRVSCSQSRRADNRKMNSLFVIAAARSQDRGREAGRAEAEGVCAEVLNTAQDCACV